MIPTPVKLKEIKRETLVLGRELGQGEFGSVLMGVWTNPTGEKVSLIKVFSSHRPLYIEVFQR